VRMRVGNFFIDLNITPQFLSTQINDQFGLQCSIFYLNSLGLKRIPFLTLIGTSISKT